MMPFGSSIPLSTEKKKKKNAIKIGPPLNKHSRSAHATAEAKEQQGLFCLFCCFISQVNSHGHGGTVSSHNHTFFLGKLEQAVNQYFLHILSLVTDNNPS